MWASLHNRSYYSLLHGASKPTRIAERAVQLGLPAIALTDEGSITGSVSFIKALKNTCQCGHHKNLHGDKVCYGDNKKCKCTAIAQDKDFPSAKIKPILGSQFNILNGDRLEPVVVLAKNQLGWKKLVSATSEANKQENIYKNKPTLTLDKLASFCDGNLIGLSGAAGSEIANRLFEAPERLYFAHDYGSAKSLANMSNYKKAVSLAGRYQDVFGNNNFYLQVQNMNSEAIPGTAVVSNAMRAIGKTNNIPCLASSNTSYAFPDDFEDQRLLLCSSLEATLESVDTKFLQPENAWLKQFVDSHKYYIPSPQEMIDCHEQKEINVSLEIAEQCEAYSILSKPILPHFECPGGSSPDEYLKDICVRGWKDKIANIVEEAKLPEYKRQIKEELRVIQGAGLSSYFLIVEDYCRAARERGELLGNGRGSAAGSLIAYLTNITKVDPIFYGLMFERFYNEGRNTADRVSLPDVDTDFEDRDATIAYVTNKYGRDKVGQMVTFSRIQGKGSLKEVFRIRFPDIPIDEVNKITDALPDEAEIIDKLQEMKEAGEDPSIIMWALEANAKQLKPYCYVDDQGRLQGEYATAFKQAVRLEGTKKSQGKHPSGLVIANSPLVDIVPMVYDKSSKKAVAGMEMSDLEDMGLCKFDVLEIATLRKLHGISKLLATGRI